MTGDGMKLKILASAIGFLLLATAASALMLDGSCDILFSGKSTLHNFDGKVACQPFSLTSEGTTETSDILRQPVVKVLVGEMNTGRTGRDEKMRAMFEEEKYPEIQGWFGGLEPVNLLQQLRENGVFPETLEFDLQIRQIKQRIKATTRDLIVSPEQVSFMMDFPLSLASFELKPPSVLGFIKVDDQVQVEVKVLLRQQ
jgi:hypothetical protein